MQNIIYITGEINDESVEKFIRNFNAADKTQPIIIYINSEGGDVAHADVISNIIESASNVLLIAVGTIFSAAFNIFFFTNNGFNLKKVILPDTIGMAHFSWATFELDESGKVSGDGNKFLMQEMKANKHLTLTRLEKIGLNKTELNKIKNGKDCYFNRKRLQELLDYGQKT